MTYYLIISNSKHYKVLGEESFGSFYPEKDGMDTLYYLAQTLPSELISELKIKNEQSKEFTIEEFLTHVSTLKIHRIPN